MRRRRLRADKGTTRASHRASKRHARLRAEPKLRGLRQQPSDEAGCPVAELASAREEADKTLQALQAKSGADQAELAALRGRLAETPAKKGP